MDCTTINERSWIVMDVIFFSWKTICESLEIPEIIAAVSRFDFGMDCSSWMT